MGIPRTQKCGGMWQAFFSLLKALGIHVILFDSGLRFFAMPVVTEAQASKVYRAQTPRVRTPAGRCIAVARLIDRFAALGHAQAIQP